jgi:hypothetical protein
MNLMEIGSHMWTEFICLRIRVFAGSYEHVNEPFGSIKDRELLE